MIITAAFIGVMCLGAGMFMYAKKEWPMLQVVLMNIAGGAFTSILLKYADTPLDQVNHVETDVSDRVLGGQIGGALASLATGFVIYGMLPKRKVSKAAPWVALFLPVLGTTAPDNGWGDLVRLADSGLWNLVAHLFGVS